MRRPPEKAPAAIPIVERVAVVMVSGGASNAVAYVRAGMPGAGGENGRGGGGDGVYEPMHRAGALKSHCQSPQSPLPPLSSKHVPSS